jgi:CRP/FNR family transcriptional regulator, cyclic AMP receptor protein
LSRAAKWLIVSNSAGAIQLSGVRGIFDGDVIMVGPNNVARGFWTRLTGTEQASLSDLGMTRVYPPGATLCHEGDPATHLYILVAGWVKIISVTREGQERVQALRGNGDVVGEMAGDVTGQRTATMKAVDRVRALIIGYDRFHAFLDATPAAARAYRRAMTERSVEAAARLRRQSVANGAQRLAALLLELAERHGTGTPEGSIHVVMPLSQDELASLAGASRATVTRAYRNWRGRGLVRTATRRITILDLDNLKKIADQGA